ncbi:MAG: hypothetical protein ACYCWW_03235 [Deltaproteobacteria bacterium]
MVALLAIARLCGPSSELHIAEDWYRKTALANILGVAVDRVTLVKTLTTGAARPAIRETLTRDSLSREVV